MVGAAYSFVKILYSPIPTLLRLTALAVGQMWKYMHPKNNSLNSPNIDSCRAEIILKNDNMHFLSFLKWYGAGSWNSSSWETRFGLSCIGNTENANVPVKSYGIALVAWGPFYYNGLTLVPTWISNYINYKMRDEITWPFTQTSTVQPLKLGNAYVISSHTLLGMWLFIHDGIKVNLCL